MSQARVQQSVFAARKGATLKCGNCRLEIAKGERYRWFKVGFRSGFKQVRCMRSACTPRPSQLESSMLSGAYSAIEDAEANLSTMAEQAPEENVDNIKSELESAAEGIRDVGQQYRDAAEAMGDAGGDSEERADTLESSADDLGGWDADAEEPDFDGCSNEDHDEPALERGSADCEECVEIRDRWWADQIDSAKDALANVEMP